MIENLKIELLTKTAKLPTRGNYNDAGLDLCADEEISIDSGKYSIIKTGIKMAIPDGYAGLIWDKGGMAKIGLHTMAGVIDSGYRGEVCINIINHSKQSITINKGQKIAQILIHKISLCNVIEEKINDNTDRGDGKYGSTGLY